MKWLRRKQRRLIIQYNAFFTPDNEKAYTDAVALINEHSEMFSLTDFAIFLGLSDDKVTPVHFKRIADLLFRLQGPRNPPEMIEHANALQCVMFEQCTKMPPDEQVLRLLEDINLIQQGLYH